MNDLVGGVLIVDDDYLVAQAWALSLEFLGLTVCGVASTAEEAMTIVKRHRPGLVLLDVRLKERSGGVPDIHGIRLAADLQHAVGCPIIFITGCDDEDTRRKMLNVGPAAILIKPFRPEQFKAAVATVAMASVTAGPAVSTLGR